MPFFRRLLPLLPPEVHVTLIGRSLPPTPLWRMRSKQTLCVLDEPSLAFTPEEARQLFASYGLDEPRAESVLKQTRGRAATFDAATRSLGVAEEAARIVAARDGDHDKGARARSASSKASRSRRWVWSEQWSVVSGQWSGKNVW